jgi:hypothetical protein
MPVFVIIVGLSIGFYIFCLVKLSSEDKHYFSSPSVVVRKLKHPGIYAVGSPAAVGRPATKGVTTLHIVAANPGSRPANLQALRSRPRSFEPHADLVSLATTVRVKRYSKSN